MSTKVNIVNIFNYESPTVSGYKFEPDVLFQRDLVVVRTTTKCRRILIPYIRFIGFGGLEVACWPLEPKFAGSNPAEDVGFLRAKKILRTPSFGGEVKPSVPCRRFAASKRSLELRGSRILGQNLSEHFSPTEFHLPLLEVSCVVGC